MFSNKRLVDRFEEITLCARIVVFEFRLLRHTTNRVWINDFGGFQVAWCVVVFGMTWKNITIRSIVKFWRRRQEEPKRHPMRKPYWIKFSNWGACALSPMDNAQLSAPSMNFKFYFFSTTRAVFQRKRKRVVHGSRKTCVRLSWTLRIYRKRVVFSLRDIRLLWEFTSQYLLNLNFDASRQNICHSNFDVDLQKPTARHQCEIPMRKCLKTRLLNAVRKTNTHYLGWDCASIKTQMLSMSLLYKVQ